jgi:hypothetical protein
MHPRTTAIIAANAVRIRDGHALKLRVVHYKHAAKIAAHARIVHLHAKKLLKLEQEIKSEAVAIAGPDYKEYHDLGYDEHGSMESQRAVDDGSVNGPGIVDVVEIASSIATYAGRIATEASIRSVEIIFVLS